MGRPKKQISKQKSSGKPPKYVAPANSEYIAKGIPQQQEADQNWYKEKFRWSQRSMDHEFEGEWDWNLTPKEARLILSNLEEMSEKTWEEISKETSGKKSRAKSHSQSVGDIVAEAQSRLPHLQVDAEELYRVRIGYSERLWGYRVRGCFHVLWYDRDHKIYDD